jgi:metal-responsive CopG/Arc/MetJ family transcriptional regulator
MKNKHRIAANVSDGLRQTVEEIKKQEDFYSDSEVLRAAIRHLGNEKLND